MSRLEKEQYTSQKHWWQISFSCIVLFLIFSWYALTDGVPATHHLMFVDGTVSSAGWTGAKYNAFQLRLVSDQRAYVIDDDMTKNRLGPPQGVNWIGKHVRFLASKQPTWLLSRTVVYSLILEGRPIYSIDEIAQRQDGSRPMIALISVVFAFAGVWSYRRYKHLSIQARIES